jgi:phage shock protein A
MTHALPAATLPRQLSERDICPDCYLPARVERTEHDVEVLRQAVAQLTTEVRESTARHEAMLTQHARNMAETLVRFQSSIERTDTELGELLGRMREAVGEVETDRRRRRRPVKPKGK